jgi:RNA polymerase subunit RPABC4/transcription elongation factor Spt4
MIRITTRQTPSKDKEFIAVGHGGKAGLVRALGATEAEALGHFIMQSTERLPVEKSAAGTKEWTRAVVIRDPHEGWSNYVTWLVAYWIDNTESIYDPLVAMMADCPSHSSNDLMEWFRDMLPEAGDIRGSYRFNSRKGGAKPGLFILLHTMMEQALAEVNWVELRDHYGAKAEEIRARRLGADVGPEDPGDAVRGGPDAASAGA